jgi:hypothetical protein
MKPATKATIAVTAIAADQIAAGRAKSRRLFPERAARPLSA